MASVAQHLSMPLCSLSPMQCNTARGSEIQNLQPHSLCRITECENMIIWMKNM